MLVKIVDRDGVTAYPTPHSMRPSFYEFDNVYEMSDFVGRSLVKQGRVVEVVEDNSGQGSLNLDADAAAAKAAAEEAAAKAAAEEAAVKEAAIKNSGDKAGNKAANSAPSSNKQ